MPPVWKLVQSTHLAEPVVRKAYNEGLDLLEINAFDSYGGKGVKAIVEGREVIIGNRTLFEDNNIKISDQIEANILQLESEGKTVVIMAMNGALSCIIAVADTLKESTADAISELKKMGLKIAMITGDNTITAEAIALQVGINKVISEVLP